MVVRGICGICGHSQRNQKPLSWEKGLRVWRTTRSREESVRRSSSVSLSNAASKATLSARSPRDELRHHGPWSRPCPSLPIDRQRALVADVVQRMDNLFKVHAAAARSGSPNRALGRRSSDGWPKCRPLSFTIASSCGRGKSGRGTRDELDRSTPCQIVGQVEAEFFTVVEA